VKRIQDSVHGLIEFVGRESLAIEILRTPELQRMRRIRQLGLGQLVFPAAEHSRFVHSLGAAHLGSRFASALRTSTRDFLAPGLQADESVTRDLVLAGLCHDLGHGPLSHAWERYVIGGPLTSEAFSRWARALELPARPWLKEGMKWHELVTQAFLLSPASELQKYLEQVESGLPDRVAALLGDHYYLPYFGRLLSSDVDIDRGDYILRDAFQTGVAYGRYDLDWLVSTVTVGYLDREPVVGFDRAKGSRVVEQFLVARRAMYDTVYFHKAVRSAERMVGRLLSLVQRQLIDEGSVGAPAGFETLETAIRGEALGIGAVTELDDYLLWGYIDRLAHSASNAVIQDYASRIRVRDLYRPLPLTASQLELFLSEPARAVEVAEHVLRKFVSGDPRSYLLFNRVGYTFFEPGAKGSMFIDSRASGRPATSIREHEDLFHHPPGAQTIRNLFVPREVVEPLTRAIERDLQARDLGGEGLTSERERELEGLLEEAPLSGTSSG
jgi:HD superfamily phosphohydrolase